MKVARQVLRYLKMFGVCNPEEIVSRKEYKRHQRSKRQCQRDLDDYYRGLGRLKMFEGTYTQILEGTIDDSLLPVGLTLKGKVPISVIKQATAPRGLADWDEWNGIVQATRPY